MTRNQWKRHLWVKAGAIGSLLALVLSVFRGHPFLGRISAGFAGAFLERWDDLRLEKKVASVLARARENGEAVAPGTVTEDDLARLWGRT